MSFEDKELKDKYEGLKRLLDGIQSMVGYWDTELKNIYANSAYTDNFNKSPEQIYGCKMRDLLGEDLFQKNLPHIQATLNGETQTFERVVLSANSNEWKHVLVKYVPDFIDGKVVGFFTTVTDITAIKAREQKIRVVLDTMSDGMVVHDSSGTIRYFNPAALKILGLTESQLLGKTSTDLGWKCIREDGSDFPIEERPSAVALREQRTIRDVRIGVHLPNGEIRWCRTNASPFEGNITLGKDNTYVPRGVIVTFSDISEELRVKEALEIERVKSIRMSKLASLGELSAGVAHEINNPLAIIVGTVELITNTMELPERAKSKVKIIEAASNRIEKIVKGLKKFSRSFEKPEMQRCDLSSIIQESLTLIETKAKRHETTITTGCRCLGSIMCNEVEIEQVLVNLLSNAIDAVKSLKDRWVKVCLWEDETHVVLQVVDSGEGLAPHIEAKLFQPFFTTKPIGQGTGLGLSIVKGILDEHKASIELIKQAGNTCFEVRFLKN